MSDINSDVLEPIHRLNTATVYSACQRYVNIVQVISQNMHKVKFT